MGRRAYVLTMARPNAADADPGFVIRVLASDAEASACARLMAATDPWLTLGRTFEESYRIVRDPGREVYVAVDASPKTEDVDGSSIAGFVIICMQGAFVGYIQTVAVRGDRRGHGLGSALIDFTERRILRDEPNVFICVSSFNPRARRLYERLGYTVVGELTDYIVRGHSEILLRKTIGPLAEHVPARPARAT